MTITIDRDIDSFDLAEALYVYCSQYHSGQGSHLYHILSYRLCYGLNFKPRPSLCDADDLEEAGREVFDALVREDSDEATENVMRALERKVYSE